MGKVGQLRQAEQSSWWAARWMRASTSSTPLTSIQKGARKITGQALKNLKVPRENVVVATKVFGETGTAGVNSRGSSRYHIIGSVKEACVACSSIIDLYQLHGFDPATPIEESVYALDNLVQHGRPLYRRVELGGMAR